MTVKSRFICAACRLNLNLDHISDTVCNRSGETLSALPLKLNLQEQNSNDLPTWLHASSSLLTDIMFIQVTVFSFISLFCCSEFWLSDINYYLKLEWKHLLVLDAQMWGVAAEQLKPLKCTKCFRLLIGPKHVNFTFVCVEIWPAFFWIFSNIVMRLCFHVKSVRYLKNASREIF